MFHPKRGRFIPSHSAGKSCTTYLVKYHNTFTLHAEFWEAARNCQTDSQDIWDRIRRSCQMNHDARTETELQRLRQNLILQQCHLLSGAVQATVCIWKRLSLAPKQESQNAESSYNSFTGFFFKNLFSPDLFSTWQPGICLNQRCKHSLLEDTFSPFHLVPAWIICPSPALSLLSPLTRVVTWFFQRCWSDFSHGSSRLAPPQQCCAGLAHFTLPLTPLAAILPNFILLVSQLLRDAF